MALINLEIPEEDGWQDDLAGRLLLLLLGGFFLHLGFRFWAGVAPEGIIAALPTLTCYAIGVQLMVLCVSDVDLERWGRPITYVTVVAMTVVVLAVLWQSGSTWINRLNTDALTFSSYSVELLAHGHNPFAASMKPSMGLFGTGRFWTRRTDGSIVLSLSYPAGSVLWFLPQYLLIGRGPIGVRLTVILATGLLGIVLVSMLPGQLAAAAPLTLVAARQAWLGAAGGVLEALWLLPVVLAMRAWYQERWATAAAWVGAAAATKQFVWISIPFLAIWLYRIHNRREFVRVTGRCLATGGGVFLALNLPFIVDSPTAWLTSVVTPLGSGGAPLVVEGGGLAVLHMGGLEFPRWAFTVAVVCAVAISLLAYWRWFETLRWAAWVMPPVILFFHSRSLASYFNYFLPVALIACVAVYGRLRTDGILPASQEIRSRLRSWVRT